MSYCPHTPQMRWRNIEHKAFFDHMIHDLEGAEGPYTRLIVALLSGCPITRQHFWEIYNNHFHCIKPDCWDAGWNTPESHLVIALAAMLSGDLDSATAASGTLAPSIVDAFVWSDYIDSTVCGVSYA